MSTFIERFGEKQGQRRKRYLEFLRNLPKPKGTFVEKTKKWIPLPKEPTK
jgi:hypothetical protein